MYRGNTVWSDNAPYAFKAETVLLSFREVTDQGVEFDLFFKVYENRHNSKQILYKVSMSIGTAWTNTKIVKMSEPVLATTDELLRIKNRMMSKIDIMIDVRTV